MGRLPGLGRTLCPLLRCRRCRRRRPRRSTEAARRRRQAWQAPGLQAAGGSNGRRRRLVGTEQEAGMSSDEQAIRDLVANWMRASQAGDTETVLSLMTDDAVFLLPGREPFGKQAFAAAAQNLQGARMEGSSEIRELKVLGDSAYLRGYLQVSITPPGGNNVRRAGYTLTIFNKQADGRWLLARDANLLTDAT